MQFSGAIANYFLEKKGLSGVQINGLVYYSHAWNLAIREKPLINDVVFATEYGIMIPSLRLLYPDPFDTIYIGKSEFYSEDNEPKEYKADQSLDILNAVWERYGDYTSIQMSNSFHSREQPWYSLPRGESREFYIMSNDLIKRKFKEIKKYYEKNN